MSDSIVQYDHKFLTAQNCRKNIDIFKEFVKNHNIKKNSCVRVALSELMDLLYVSIALLELDCSIIPILDVQARGKDQYLIEHSNYEINRADHDAYKLKIINEKIVMMRPNDKAVCDCYLDSNGNYSLQEYHIADLQDEFYNTVKIKEASAIYVDKDLPLPELIATVFLAFQVKASIILDILDRADSSDDAGCDVYHASAYIAARGNDHLPQGIFDPIYRFTRTPNRLSIQKGGHDSPDDLVVIRNQAFTIQGYEAVCNRYMHVDQAIVLIENERIFLYCIPANDKFKTEDFELFLVEYFHSDIMPRAIYKLSEFPYRSNTEIDRSILPFIAKQSEKMAGQFKNNENDPVVQKLIALIQVNNYPEFSYADLDKSFIDLGINSIAFIELAVLVEDEFEFEFSDDMLDIEMFQNVDSLITYIKQSL